MNESETEKAVRIAREYPYPSSAVEDLLLEVGGDEQQARRCLDVGIGGRAIRWAREHLVAVKDA